MARTLTPEQIEVYAATLRAQIGVTRVWVFGSLAEGDHFTQRSDLVDLDHCPHGLRRAVEQSGVDL